MRSENNSGACVSCRRTRNALRCCKAIAGKLVIRSAAKDLGILPVRRNSGIRINVILSETGVPGDRSSSLGWVAKDHGISPYAAGIRKIKLAGCPIKAGWPTPAASLAARLGWAGVTFILALLLLFSAPALHAKKTAVLDRVVAVVGDQAILASDVNDEMRFAALQQGTEQSGDNTPQRALDRVIDRTLIDEQRALQPGIAEVPQKDVEQSIVALRASIPACAQYHCNTDAGWQSFLAVHGFTPSEVADRIRQRLAILQFIDLRFSVAARVANADVQKYYDQVLKPELERDKAALPDLSVVAPRIREILRQQQVSAMLDQWLNSLRSEQHVRILDSAYGTGESGQ